MVLIRYRTDFHKLCGNMIVGGNITGNYCIANSGAFIGTSSSAILGVTSGDAGTVYLRPNGYGSSTGQTSISSTGSLTAGGNLDAGPTGGLYGQGCFVGTFSSTEQLMERI